jgi:hypothetical protein
MTMNAPAATTEEIAPRAASGGCLQRAASAKSEYEQLQATHAKLLDETNQSTQYKNSNTNTAAVPKHIHRNASVVFMPDNVKVTGRRRWSG